MIGSVAALTQRGGNRENAAQPSLDCVAELGLPNPPIPYLGMPSATKQKLIEQMQIYKCKTIKLSLGSIFFCFFLVTMIGLAAAIAISSQ